MREAMAHRGGGGPAGYGGSADGWSRSSAYRDAMRHVLAAPRARIGERAVVCGGEGVGRRGWPCARADRPRRGAGHVVSEGVWSGGIPIRTTNIHSEISRMVPPVAFSS